MKRKVILIIHFLCLLLYAKGQSLDSLLIEAAQHNPALKAQYEQYLAALERVDQKEALPDPTLSFGYFISPVETRVGPQQFKISIAQMFPWMGTSKQKGKVATAEAKVFFEQFMQERNRLFLQIKNTHADLYLVQKELAFKQEEIEVLESFEPTVRSKYESNLVSLTDLIRVQLSIEDANTQLAVLRSTKKGLVSQLNTLINRPKTMSIESVELPRLQDYTPIAIDTLLMANPSILMKQARITASEELVKLSSIRNRPSIGVGLDYAFVGKRNDINPTDNGRDILMPMISLSLPIFGKKNEALIKEANHIKASATYELEAELNRLENEWTQAEFQLEQAELLKAQYEREIEQKELMLNILIGEYTNRSTNFEDVLSTEKQLIMLKFALEKVKITQYKALIKKEFIAGDQLLNLISYENE